MKRVEFGPSPVTWINDFVFRSRRLKFVPSVILGVIWFVVVLAVVAGAVAEWREPRNEAAESEQERGLTNIQPSEIRIRNGSDIPLIDVVVGGKKYGNIGPGGTTEYQTWTVAYRAAGVGFRTSAGVHGWSPIDYVGEVPLGKGRFTYVLTPMKAFVESYYTGEVPSGNPRLTYMTPFNDVAINLVRDDPTGIAPSSGPPQQPSPTARPPLEHGTLSPDGPSTAHPTGHLGAGGSGRQ